MRTVLNRLRVIVSDCQKITACALTVIISQIQSEIKWWWFKNQNITFTDSQETVKTNRQWSRELVTALLICSFVSCSIRGYAFYSHICVCICICICICIYICICVCFCICYCILQVVRYRLYSHTYVSVFGYAFVFVSCTSQPGVCADDILQICRDNIATCETQSPQFKWVW